MIAENIMNTTLHTLLPTNSLKDALQLMHEEKIRHIPIVDEAHTLLGIVTANDIKLALPSSLYDESYEDIYNAPVERIMTKNPIVGHPLDFVEDIASTLYDAKVSCVPIVSKGKLVGLLTTTDLLYAFIELTGSHKPSSKIDIRVDDQPGMLNKITDVIKQHNANILSILVYPDSEAETCILSIRLQVINPLIIIENFKQQGYEVLWPIAPGMIV